VIACLYHVSKTNVGDQVCCPADYFNLGDIVRIDLPWWEKGDGPRVLRESRTIVVGGGGVFYFENEVKRLIDAHGHKVIVWGAGANRHGSRRIQYPATLDRCLLLGLRDWGSAWVPCVSCMSPLFDAVVKEPPREDVVLYEHEDYPILSTSTEWPRLTNNATLEAALRFLGSGRRVVTNSYHGAYWATLLGRQAIIHRPFSSKFYRMPWQPPISYTFAQLQERLESDVTPSGAGCLEAARERTREFYARARPYLI